MWESATLESELNRHDELIVQCARGEIGVREFLEAYDSFYQRGALDGHEGGEDILDNYSSRIAIHRAVWDKVEVHLATEENANNPVYSAVGFIGEKEARRRIREIAIEGGLL